MLKQALHEVDLTHVQFALLRSCQDLNERKGPLGVTQTQIAQSSYSDPMMASEVLRTLEKKGYVNRIPHPQDTRAKLIQLTESGVNAVERANEIVMEAERLFFSKLGPEMNDFVRQLKILLV
ncbi:DNA-binding transcriptional repressor MarR [compost metagenome]